MILLALVVGLIYGNFDVGFFSGTTLPKKFHRNFFFQKEIQALCLFGIPSRLIHPKLAVAQLPSQQALKDFDAASGMLRN